MGEFKEYEVSNQRRCGPFLEVVVNRLKVFTTVDDDSVVLIVRLSVTKDWVTRKFDPELWPPLSSLDVEFGVAIDERRRELRISPLLGMRSGVQGMHEAGTPTRRFPVPLC